MATVYLPDKLASVVAKNSELSLVQYVKKAVEEKLKTDGHVVVK